MAINLHEKYAAKLAEAFTSESLLAGKTNNEWEFVGFKSLKIPSIITQTLNNYNRTATGNRYGTPAELQDQMQEVQCVNDKSFAITIDKGNNNEQQMVKKAGVVMKQQIREQVVPVIDKCAMLQWAKGSGNVISASAAPTKTTIIEMLVKMENAMDDAFVPTTDRYVAMPNATIGLFRQSLTNCDGVTDKLLLKNIAGQFGTLKILGVPASWMPANCYALAWHKSAVILAQKIRDNKLHMDPPGISGALLEGRYIYDGFVVGARCDAVVALVASANKAAAPTATASSGNITLASTTSNATIKYTTDGSDPRFSASAHVYSAPFTAPASGSVVKAVAFANGVYNSDLLVHTVA